MTFASPPFRTMSILGEFQTILSLDNNFGNLLVVLDNTQY